jgi:hypothetical protein
MAVVIVSTYYFIGGSGLQQDIKRKSEVERFKILISDKI